MPNSAACDIKTTLTEGDLLFLYRIDLPEAIKTVYSYQPCYDRLLLCRYIYLILEGILSQSLDIEIRVAK